MRASYRSDSQPVSQLARLTLFGAACSHYLIVAQHQMSPDAQTAPGKAQNNEEEFSSEMLCDGCSTI